ncbi:NAD(P)/FAD-dependent oxidoreductase [Heyndrickxia sporothermodurans]|uniref:NAD(P)/FAD-dependent oxidoreductase n=1 Tax=Heyndrickxia sporothermodurans TaxID=46224 RepID=UPI00192C679B|nr:NAD(P)/FAD-dependent oxidoreductase [Heyndrickxia sporothermodurans]MBL5831986.1 FAD-dependent oxidoreductase [Heyndrickxia sporothermodurans]
METDVLIIGAGPAGLLAAYETVSRGLDVVIIDESSYLGGQLPQQAQMLSMLPSQYPPMRGFELAELLINQLHEFPVKILLNHSFIGLYQDGSIGVSDGENVFPISAKKVIVTTGAAERAVPFLKWTLPGVMTIGAAQTLVNRDFVVPGKKAVIFGSSDFALDVAIQLKQVGVEIEGIIEKSTKLTARDTDKINLIKQASIPIYLNSFIKEVGGNGQVEEVYVQQDQEVKTFHVDLVCVDGGRKPITEVFYQLDCSFSYQEKLGGWVPQYNERFQSSQEKVYLGGNAAGVSFHGSILLTGMIAGISVCEDLGVLKVDEANSLRDSLFKEIKIIESKQDEHLWLERMTHIENFLHPKLKNQFIS